jgi:hypothetical protein
LLTTATYNASVVIVVKAIELFVSLFLILKPTLQRLPKQVWNGEHCLLADTKRLPFDVHFQLQAI